jgi:DNA-binding transcriptional regulator YiaG
MGTKMKEQDKLLYTACGLDNVYLLNGYHVVETKRGRMIRIDDQQGLHRAIGEYLVRQKRSLVGKELRFLRHQLGLSQPALATLLGESEQSVARREKRRKGWKKPIPQDRMLRYMFEQRLSGNEKLEEFLRSLADLDEANMTKVEFKKSKKTAQWERAEEAVAA